MTEIPEHLLQRSKAARSKASDEGDAGDSGGDAGGASAAPVKATASTPAPAAATPAPVEATPPPPPPPYVEAYKNRRRIPMWAMPVLAALPLWAYLFQGTLEPPPEGAESPAALGEEIYANRCAACHGGNGGGISGPGFNDGAIYVNWPKFADQVEWIRLGSAQWGIENNTDTYGVANTPISGNMPGFGAVLSDAELLYVVAHERDILGGPNPDEADHALLLAALDYADHNPDATIEEILAAVASGEEH